MKAIPVKATTISPFHYGHLAIQDGVATASEFIGDRAILFSLCSALGMIRPAGKLPTKDYRRDITMMPFRSSIFTTEDAILLPPLARRSDVGVEGGRQARLMKGAGSGNAKEYFVIQEASHEIQYQGYIFGVDPFEVTGQEQLVTRIGAMRTGSLLLQRDDRPKDEVYLNAATATLFNRTLPVERFILYEMQASRPLTVNEAAEEVSQWR